MNNMVQLFYAGVTAILLSGCVSTSLTSDIDPATDLSALQSFYVAKFEKDGRGIHEKIAAELNAMGKTATSGQQESPASPVDAVVTYQDKWMWDITMYMIELNIDMRDPETDYKFATGRSYRTSLARKSPENMIKEVLGEMFGVPSDGEDASGESE